MLVAAVLRPEQGEDRELEVVRLPPEQGDDTVELLVGEAERAVDRLCHGGACGHPRLARRDYLTRAALRTGHDLTATDRAPAFLPWSE